MNPYDQAHILANVLRKSEEYAAYCKAINAPAVRSILGGSIPDGTRVKLVLMLTYTTASVAFFTLMHSLLPLTSPSQKTLYASVKPIPFSSVYIIGSF